MTAREIVVDIRDAKYPTQFYLSNSEAVALVDADRKAVRKECADRALRWLDENVPLVDDSCEALRSAIMGKE